MPDGQVWGVEVFVWVGFGAFVSVGVVVFGQPPCDQGAVVFLDW